jgi:hypothetical protein
MKTYYIYRVDSTGNKTYSRGGTGPDWARTQKIWGLGPLKSHLGLLCPFFNRSKYKMPDDLNKYGVHTGTLLPKVMYPYGENCYVVEVDEATNTINKYPAPQWIWNNSTLPRIKAEMERSAYQAAKIDERVGGYDLALALMEPTRVEPLDSSLLYTPLPDEEAHKIIGDEAVTLELFRRIEEAVRLRIAKLK